MRAPGIQMVPNAMPSGGAPTLRVAKPGGFDALQQGAAAVGQAADRIQAGYEKEQHEAAVVEARDSLTAYQHDTTDTLHGASNVTPGAAADAAFAGRDVRTGFLSTRGKAAAETSADTLDELEEKRQKRAEGITNAKARELFLMSSAEAYENTRRTVESHVSQEIERAKVDSIAAAEDEATRAVALDPGNDKLAAERIASVVGPLASLGRGQEFTDRAALQVQQKVASARLDALLNPPEGQPVDIETAKRVLDTNKWALGTRLDEYRKALGGAEIGATAEAAADGILSRAQQATVRQPFAAPDRATAEALLAKLPADVQRKAAPIVRERLALLKEDANTQRTEFVRSAKSAFNRNRAGFFATPMADRLNDVDPDAYAALQNHSEQALARAERKQRIRQNDAAAVREQKAIDKIALNEWDAELLKNASAADIESFKVDHDDMSEQAKSELEKRKLKAVKGDEKAGPQAAGSFTTSALADAEGFLPQPGTTPHSKEIAKAARDDFRGRALREFHDFLEEKGRAPTSEEAANMRGKLIRAMPPNPERPETVARSAEAISRGGGGAAPPRVPGAAPATGAPKPSKRDRALALKAAGKSNAEIAKMMTDEGY